MANYMKQVAEMLGVELGQTFKVINAYAEKEEVEYYKITETGGLMCRYEEDAIWFGANEYLSTILLGDWEVVKSPYKPAIGDTYWTYTRSWNPIALAWGNDFNNLVIEKTGAVFRTEAEAIAARPRIYKELTGKAWRDEIAYGLKDGDVLL